MTLLEWINLGVEKGWISDPFCNTHEGGPSTEEEDAEWEDGGDPCATHLRLWGEL